MTQKEWVAGLAAGLYIIFKGHFIPDWLQANICSISAPRFNLRNIGCVSVICEPSVSVNGLFAKNISLTLK